MLDDIETHIENDNEQATMALLRTLKTAFTGLRIFLILLIAVYLFSGIYKVDEKEHALQMRFGKIIKVSTEPGIYFGLPKPFNSVVKINAKKMRRLEVKFWYKETAQNPLSRDAPANTSGDLHILDDGYNLTGDYNILHTIHWSRTVLVHFAYNSLAQNYCCLCIQFAGPKLVLPILHTIH